MQAGRSLTGSRRFLNCHLPPKQSLIASAVWGSPRLSLALPHDLPHRSWKPWGRLPVNRAPAAAQQISPVSTPQKKSIKAKPSQPSSRNSSSSSAQQPPQPSSTQQLTQQQKLAQRFQSRQSGVALQDQQLGQPAAGSKQSQRAGEGNKQAAAKAADPAAALRAYDTARQQGITLAPHLYDTLLYLCADGDKWEEHLHALNPQPTPHELLAPLPILSTPAASSSGVDSSTAALSQGLVREPEGQAAALNGAPMPSGAASDGQPSPPKEVLTPQQLFARGQELLEQGPQTPRLRSFVPALKAFATLRMVDEVFQVDDLIKQHSLDLTEAEFAILLGACAYDTDAARGLQVLERMGRELTVLSDATLAAAVSFFRSSAALSGGSGAADSLQNDSAASRSWQLQRCAVDAVGVSVDVPSTSANDCLEAMDLDDSEWGAFAEGISAVAMERERAPDDFRTFMAWLKEHGPFHVIIDGANVALFGQNFDHGGFSFTQIKAVLAHLRSQHPDLRPLVLLHKGRTQAPVARQPENQKLLQQLEEDHEIYLAPYGSNDDWYWIYAAVIAEKQGLLMSNDEMRDHIFQLLAPKYFHKWKQRHQVRYRLHDSLAEFAYPAAYTICLQRLASGAWMLPSAAQPGLWLCASPARGDHVPQ
ncbi:hypothetical protein WJX73_010279 [Symbiochloris irregularis]|uniref:Mitochondrial ribonuclease P catalytic subunit n=1 Tax=Symbiochloris irregularis TaxID=706552 RepID=A0AAW1PC55_9CHLO